LLAPVIVHEQCTGRGRIFPRCVDERTEVLGTQERQVRREHRHPRRGYLGEPAPQRSDRSRPRRVFPDEHDPVQPVPPRPHHSYPLGPRARRHHGLDERLPPDDKTRLVAAAEPPRRTPRKDHYIKTGG
jgi:hypothetical protein